MNQVWKLSLCFGLLIALIAAVPVFAITEGWVGSQIATLAVAVMLVLSMGAPKADVQRSILIFKPLAIAVIFPVAWMLLQILPVPLGSIEHPVWRSAAAALNESLSGHVSIDLGFTFRSLISYLSLLSLTFVASILATDRDRAETALFSLCAITTFMAVELILFRDLAVFQTDSPSNGLIDSLIASSVLGTILNTASVIRGVERYRTDRQRQPGRYLIHAAMMLAGSIGAVICLFAVLQASTFNVLIAMAFGLTALCLVVLIRRLDLDRWSAAVVCGVVVVMSAGVVALRFAANPSAMPLFRFTKVETADAGGVIQRMVYDANWHGGGVGTYQALASIYRDIGDAAVQVPPNTAAEILIEWGRGGLLLSAAFVVQLFVVLFRGALLRGRDSFFAASAAACVAAMFFGAFCDASLTHLPVQMLGAIIVGVGLSQTKGRDPARA